MSSVILASLAVPLAIVATTLLVYRLEQRTIRERTEDDSTEDRKERKDPPHDLVDLSGGTFGI